MVVKGKEMPRGSNSTRRFSRDSRPGNRISSIPESARAFTDNEPICELFYDFIFSPQMELQFSFNILFNFTTKMSLLFQLLCSWICLCCKIIFLYIFCWTNAKLLSSLSRIKECHKKTIFSVTSNVEMKIWKIRPLLYGQNNQEARRKKMRNAVTR